MAERAGLKVRVGGNLGEPALDLLSAARSDAVPTELYILELSSYQLETTYSLDLKAATVLNVTPDHMDRYATLTDYAAAKARIFARCDTAVINLDDPLVAAMPRTGQRMLSFSLRASIGADYAVEQVSSHPNPAEPHPCAGFPARASLHGRSPACGPTHPPLAGEGREGAQWWLVRRGEPLLPVSAMKIKGMHNVANALAALALGEALGLPLPVMLTELACFPGLPHRSQWVAEVRGVAYVDDSKGTNVGATIAAVSGMSGPLVMIAGGDGKNQDFGSLRDAFRGKVHHAMLIGRDADALVRVLAGVCAIQRCATLEEAVRAAARVAQPGDTVLLSPACASFDMFRDYAHRGAVFEQAVKELAA